MKHPTKLLAAVAFLATSAVNAATPLTTPVTQLEVGKTYVFENARAHERRGCNYRYLCDIEIGGKLECAENITENCLWMVEQGSTNSSLAIKNIATEGYLFTSISEPTYQSGELGSLASPIDIYIFEGSHYAHSIGLSTSKDTKDYTFINAYNTNPYVCKYSFDSGSEWWAYEVDLSNGLEAGIEKANLIIDEYHWLIEQEQYEIVREQYIFEFNCYIDNTPSLVGDVLRDGISAMDNLEMSKDFDEKITEIKNTYINRANEALNVGFADKVVALKHQRCANRNMPAFFSTDIENNNFSMVTSVEYNPNAVFSLESAEDGYYLFCPATNLYLGLTGDSSITAVSDRNDAQQIKFQLSNYMSANPSMYGVNVLITDKTGYYNAIDVNSYSGVVSLYAQGSINTFWWIELLNDDYIHPGTPKYPFYVTNALSLDNNGTAGWVKGYIVGGMTYNDIEHKNEFTTTISENTTNIVIASWEEDFGDNFMAVQLPVGYVRDDLNLKDHPQFIGKLVSVYGDFLQYCGINGVKNTSKFIMHSPIELSINKVKYSITDPALKADAVAIGVADGNFSLNGLEISDFVTFNGVDYSVTSIADNAFKDITGFKGELKIGKNVKEIGASAFSGCTGFTSLKLPEGLTTIGNSAFYMCRGLVGSLDLPQSLTSIGESAFYGCTGFKGSLNLSKSLTSIGNNAFQDCSGFNGTLNLPESLTNIGDGAFYNCSGLTGSLNLPESLTSIGNSTFYRCHGLTGSLNLPKSLMSIGSSAFSHCIGLTGTLSLPESLTTIGNSAFYNCSGLTGSLNLPESLTSIGSSVFSGCSGLNGSLNIPANISTINSNAFANTKFEKVICHRETAPECSTDAFSGARKETLQVPENSITAYMLKAPWSEFKNIYSLEPLAGIEFAEANVVCPLGGSVKLKVNKTPFGAEGEITFISGNTAVATVDANGVVTGMAKGSTAIIAMSGTLTASCVVTVEDPTVAANALEFEGIIGNVGETVAIGAKVLPEDATDPTISWQSSNPKVAAVDADGVVWFNAAGNATVTAECQGYEFSMPFVVKEVVAKALNVFPIEAVGNVGHQFSLLALHEPENTTDKSVTWESSDPEVATVSKDGRVSLASLGTAQITARSGEHTAVCAVTVDNTVGLTEMALTGVVIDIVDGGIIVRNAPVGEMIAVYAVDGKAVNGAFVESEETRLNLATGIYIVKVSPSTVAKVLIK